MLPVVPFSMPDRPLSESDKVRFMAMKSIVTSLRCRRKVNHRSSLNGSHGEFTDTDDVKRGHNPPQKKRKNSQPQPRRQAQRRTTVSRARNMPMSLLAGGGPSGQVALSKCAAKFLLAQTDAFSKDAVGACVPVPGSRNTLRFTGVARGTVSTGTLGAGYLSIHPTVSNTGVICICSNVENEVSSTVKPTILAATDDFQVGIGPHFMSSIPYSNGDLTENAEAGRGAPSVFGKVVGGEIIIRNTTAQLYKQGVNYATSSPTHENVSRLISQKDAADDGVLLTGTSGPYTRAYTADEVIRIPFGPNTPSECIFSQNQEITSPYSLAVYPLSHGETVLTSIGNRVYNNDGVGVGAAPIVVWFTGASSSHPNSYSWEIIQHLEFAGPSADALGLPVESDAVGVQRVQSAVSQIFSASIANHPGSKPRSFTRLALDALRETAVDAAPAVISSLARSLPSLLL